MPTESGERKAARGQSTGAPPPQETDQALPCPRCDSINTKFCYYNNYNLSQPRYFCKACRRYWTRGGTLRNVPVGGGCRKNSKRSRTASNAASNASTASSGSSSGGGSNPRSDSVYGLDPMALKLQVPAAPVPAEVNLGGSGGSFTSLLGAQGCASSGFLALGGFGLGIGSGFEEMGFGLGRGAWPYQEVGIDGGHDGGGGGGGGGGGFGGATVATPMGWQLSGGGGGGGESGFSDADCGFAWPDLGISMSSNGFK